MPVYLGPSDVLIYKDKVYRQGDNVPMTAAEVAHHVSQRHRFEGNEPADTDTPFAPVQPLAQPYDDRGQMQPETVPVAAAKVPAKMGGGE